MAFSKIIIVIINLLKVPYPNVQGMIRSVHGESLPTIFQSLNTGNYLLSAFNMAETNGCISEHISFSSSFFLFCFISTHRVSQDVK